MQTTLTIDEIVKEFLSEQDIAENSCLTYRRVLSGFFRWLHLEKKDKRSVSKSDLLEWKSYLLKSHAVTYTCSCLSVIKKFYIWLEMKGYYYNNPAKNIHLPKRYSGFRKEPFVFQDVLSVINKIDKSTSKGFRDFVILNLLLRI